MKDLLKNIRELILSARTAVVHSVDLIQVLTNFEIGRRIVEHEQQGSKRAEYGKALLKALSAELTAEFGRGFSRSNLEYMRRFYLTYQDRTLRIAQAQSAIFPPDGKSQMPSGKFPGTSKSQIPSGKLVAPFRLSWSQYVFLTSIDNLDERRFYEIEADSNDWSLSELKCQFNSGLYERLALSRDKDGVRKLAAEGQIVAQPEDLLKEPYVLEFLGLDEQAKYSESDLETAIIDKLEHFLLELGKGFLFEARQKRFTFDEEHFFVDLVLYNRLLRCYVLIDLKIGKLTHQHLGQMQMYVNYFDRFVKLDDEHPTVGIIRCRKKHDALVEITLPEDANIHAQEYRLYLPDKELLRQKLVEWGEEAERNRG
ncbi:PDDEXK nuclease domain-containing protein [Candidatus Thiosymbion oneisti]|uniref:PDDEXK nuclease domain-containing protein n=1 Tax=Candidatus Thiosymbion oneisti TaxID=589554 RepID=UPI000AA395ED|nr:PDDEXK nuclease domain-containing protein [Candidatus Thiosymbion oneisti]